MVAADAWANHHGFLPHLSSSRDVGSCCPTMLPCSNDAPSRPSSGQKPARTDTQGEGTKLLEPVHTNPISPGKDDQELSNRFALKPPKERARREGVKLKTHQIMQAGVLADCWDIEGGTAGVREQPTLHGDTSGVDTAAAAGPSGDRKEFETEERVRGGTGEKLLAAHSNEISCLGTGQENNQLGAAPGASQLWNSLIDENNALHKQVTEMEAFLKDHGLVWVGSGSCPGDEWRGGCPTSFELDRILYNIQELNDEVAREDRRRVVQTRGGAEFQTTRFLHLAFYADGIVVDNGDVRPYAERATKSFIADLRDGFFPAEFKASNPDGLMIHAVDHRAVKSTARPVVRFGEKLHTPFAGTGRRLGGGGQVNPEHSIEREAMGDAAPQSLSRRLKIDMLWKGSPASSREQRLPPLGGQLSPNDDRYFAGKRCTKPTALRVRVAPTILQMEFRMDYQETVEDLWHLIAHRISEKLDEGGHQPSLLNTHFRDILACSGRPANGPNPSTAAFELRLPYPSHKPIDLRQTIEEAGLTPNASVIFQRRERDIHCQTLGDRRRT